MKHIHTFESFLNEKNYSEDERAKMATQGHALSDGSFPIADIEDLKNAIQAFGRANDEDRSKVAKHIVARAEGLGKKDLIPTTDIFQKALK